MNVIPKLLDRWRGQGAFNAPASVDTVGYELPIKARLFCPFRDSLSFSIESYKPICSGVVRLNRLCSPPAVLWIVVSSIVFSVKAFPIWSKAHIQNESLKGQPPVTNGYSSAAVSWVVRVISVAATLVHSIPNLVCGCAGKAMLRVSSSSYLRPDAPAGCCKTLSEIAREIKPRSSALALAYEAGGYTAFLADGNYGKPTKNLTSKVFELCHSALLNVKHRKVHGKQRCSCGSGATLAMQGGF